MLSTEYAHQFGIAPQRTDESDDSFKSRVAGELRDMGEIIYAHEAATDAYYDQSADAMTGILGAVAQAMQGKDYNVSGSAQVNTDLVAGKVVQKPKDDPLMAMLMMALMGMERR